MNKLLVIIGTTLLIAAAALAGCNPLPAAQAVAATCEQYVNDGSYINAGCCYKQIGNFDDCTLYFLKGARQSEMVWNRGEDFTAGTAAMAYYYVEYWANSGLGSDMGVCATKHGDTALVQDLKDYHTWMQKFIIDSAYNGEPPFDMDARIAALQQTLHPTPVPTIECVNYYWFDASSTACGQKEFCGAYMYYGLQTFASLTECQTALAAREAANATPTPTPVPPAADYTVILIVVAIALLAAIGYFVFMKKQPGAAAPAEHVHTHEEHAHPHEHVEHKHEEHHEPAAPAAAKPTIHPGIKHNKKK